MTTWYLNVATTLLLATAAMAHGQTQFGAMLCDGSIVSGRLEGAIDDPKSNVKLDGRTLFDASNPVRVLWTDGHRRVASAPYLQLTNGDVLPGRLLRAEGLDDLQVESRLVVLPRLALPMPDRRSIEIGVRIDHVERVLFTRHDARSAEPGEVVLRNGSRMTARRIRWLPGAIRLLTAEGLISIPWSELAELRFPAGRRIGALLDDGSWPGITDDDLVVHAATRDGGRFTFPRSMVQTKFSGDSLRIPTLAIQPIWSLDALRIPAESVVFRTYHQASELPLSLLPVTETTELSAEHAWLWQRNSSVLQTPLASGAIRADLGVGSHPPCRLVFELPSYASRFSAHVGLDQAVGSRGCATVKIFRDHVDDKPLFASDYLQGGQDPQRIGPLDIHGSQSLILVTEMGHEGRPEGADPLDIRDHVNWLMPWVSIDESAVESRTANPARWAPPLTDWKTADSDRDRISFRPWWNKRQARWQMMMAPDAKTNIGDAKPFELSQTKRIDLTNALVHIAAGRDRTDSTHHRIELFVNDEKHETTMNGDVGTNAGPGDAHDRFFILREHLGQEVKLALRMTPQGSSSAKPAGIFWDSVRFSPLIEGLPEDGKPLVPKVPLASLEPTRAVNSAKKPLALQRGKGVNGTPLNVLGVGFEEGYAVPAGSSVTYELKPQYDRFIAVLGLSDGWQSVGPYEIYLDDQLHWKSEERAMFGRNDPGLQIDVQIPAGHKTIELRMGGKESQGAWANAGFQTR